MRNTDPSVLKWLWAVPGGKKLYLFFLTAVQGIYGATGVLYALLLRNVVDAAAGRDGAGFRHGIVMIVLLVTGQLALLAVMRRLSELSRAIFENLFRARLMRTLLRKDYLRVSALHSGSWLNRLTSDAMVVANNAVDIIPGLAGMAVKLVSALAMIIALEGRFAAILIPFGLLTIFVTWLFRKALKRLHRNIQEADGQARIFMQERIGSLLMVHSFAAEDRTLEETERKLENHKAARMRRNRFSNLCNIGFGAAMNAMYLLGVGWCGYGILQGTVSFGTLTAVTQLIAQIQAPFLNISGYLPRWYAMLASAERLMEAESFPDETEQALSPAEVSSLYENGLSAFGLRDAGFVYYPAADRVEALSKENMPAALDGISLEIWKGEYVAFTGQSGCGKSTVLKLLMCVYRPDSGERYYLDRAGERHELTSAHRRLFAYVPQGNALMTGTVREVVCFADPESSRKEEKLRQALEIACADGFVKELEHGADTLLGERGTGLSEGQMQRLAIARAIYSGSPILLLDESTSALDEGTEKQLLENLRRLTDRTVITVTHRPAVLSICDRVLRFTESGVAEA